MEQPQNLNYKQPTLKTLTKSGTIKLILALSLYSVSTISPSNGQQQESSISSQPEEQQEQQRIQFATPESGGYHFSKQLTPFMQVHKLPQTSNNITCNDGSQIGYYSRLNNHSKSWVIYLQGGGFCGTETGCQQRWRRSPQLMTSNFWPTTKTVDGILSSDPKENPYLWNANHIYVPYCSSDSWTGSASADQTDQAGSSGSPSFAFMGSKIIERVFLSLYEELPRELSLHEAKFILFAGDSAGATGVILNLDKVRGIVERKSNLARLSCLSQSTGNNQNVNCDPINQQPPILRGLADSGWFLDNEPYDFGRAEETVRGANNAPTEDDCDQYRCTPLQSIRQAMRLWNGQVPNACASRHPNEPWRCYFGYRAYQTLKTPLFVVQWLYDEAQLMVDNIARPDTSDQWNYVHKVVGEMRASLENVTALFAPSCLSHSLIVRRSWNQINIDGFKLPHVLNSWEEQSLLLDTSHSSAIQRSSSSYPHRLEESARRWPSAVFSESVQVNEQERPKINLSLVVPHFVNQPTIETVLVDQELPNMAKLAPIYVKDGERAQFGYDVRAMTTQRPLTPPNNNRSRARKRRRNNQQQRSKQSRQKSSPNSEMQQQFSDAHFNQAATRESNDLAVTVNPMQDLLPIIDRSLVESDAFFGRLGANLPSGRLGRSTIIDDSTLMLSNNVPDDSAANQMSALNTDQRADQYKFWTQNGFNSPNKHNQNANKFRLIDSCGWPQCNRDCPTLDSEFTQTGGVQF